MHALETPVRKAAVVAVATAILVGMWLWLRTAPPSGDAPPPATVAHQPLPEAKAPAMAPLPRHPVADAQGEAYAPRGGPGGTVDASDEATRDALTSLFGAVPLETFFNLEAFARRVVATIDNLPRAELAPRVMALRPVPGTLAVAGAEADGTLAIDVANSERYEAYVQLLSSVNTARLVGVYVHFYPFLQQAYRDLGYPSGYFNDRVIEVIDHLLATPDPERPVRLTQPRVLYRFADPGLESRSAGQKAMIRAGPNNAARIKAKLREIRNRLIPLSR